MTSATPQPVTLWPPCSQPDSEAAAIDVDDGAASASCVGLSTSCPCDFSEIDSVGCDGAESASSPAAEPTPDVGSSRVLRAGVASGSTTLVEVTVGRGASVLPEGSTVRTVVLLIVSRGGVTVAMPLDGEVVLEVVVVSWAALLMRSARFETAGAAEEEELLVELVDVELGVCEMLVVVVSIATMGDCGPCPMKKLGEMLIGRELQSQPATRVPALLGCRSLAGMLLTKPITVYANKAALSNRKIASRAQKRGLAM